MIGMLRGWRWVLPGALLLGAGMLATGRVRAGSADDPQAPPLEAPATSGETPVATPPVAALPPAAERDPDRSEGPVHEALVSPTAERVRAPKAPPPPIDERPRDNPPSVASPSNPPQWLPGYWAWDPARGDFAWVAGIWNVPPPNRIWVSGRWQRDAQGWTRIPGFWSPRRAVASNPAAPAVAAEPLTAAPAPAATPAARDWRVVGPPTNPPADDPGPAPGPDVFFIPGHYQPDGANVVWKPGFWAKLQPGWDWVPSRWVRRPGGWDYREGYWARDPNGGADVARHEVARPVAPGGAGDLPPAIVDSEPASTNNEASATPGRDPIADAEAAGRAAGSAVVVVPYPGAVIVRPPVRRGYGYGYGYGPGYAYPGPMPGPYYDPLNVTPPFVRRFLNRIMP